MVDRSRSQDPGTDAAAPPLATSLHDLARRRRPASIRDDVPDRARLDGRTLFIGLGAMKAGTTWVSQYLQAHPDVYHSPIKEMNFFNRLVDDTFSTVTRDRWLERMTTIIRNKAWSHPPRRKPYDQVRALAELVGLETETDYLNFFARRIHDERVFGEICPQYAFLPPSMYQRIEAMGFKTKFLLFMRDPTDRLASNIQHLLRRQNFDVDGFIDELGVNTTPYRRSNYLETIQRYSESRVDAPLRTFVFEEMFCDESVACLCNYLGVSVVKADFSQIANPSRAGTRLTAAQKERIREKLEPVYRGLAEHFGTERPVGWKW